MCNYQSYQPLHYAKEMAKHGDIKQKLDWLCGAKLNDISSRRPVSQAQILADMLEANAYKLVITVLEANELKKQVNQ